MKLIISNAIKHMFQFFLSDLSNYHQLRINLMQYTLNAIFTHEIMYRDFKATFSMYLIMVYILFIL